MLSNKKPDYSKNGLEIDEVIIYKGIGPNIVEPFYRGLDFFSTLPLTFTKQEEGRIAARPLFSYSKEKELSKILIKLYSGGSFKVEGLEKLGEFDCKVNYDNTWIHIIDNRKDKPNEFTGYFICGNHESELGLRKTIPEFFNH